MKVLELEEIGRIAGQVRAAGKTVALCHGCFDLMHPGHIRYLQAAKNMCDFLVVTVTPDDLVDKGPGRPVFGQALRAESLAALECVDLVGVNRWPTAVETLRLIRPDYYVKGQEFEDPDRRTEKLRREIEVLEEIGGEMRFTHEIVFSSTELLNRAFLGESNG